MSKIKLFIEDGKISLGREKLAETIKHLDGEYLVHFHHLQPKTEEEWRKYYFLLRDILFEDGETGYTKRELHDIAKNLLLLEVNQDPENVKNPEFSALISTTNLTEQGWQKYVQLFKEWAFESFNCFL